MTEIGKKEGLDNWGRRANVMPRPKSLAGWLRLVGLEDILDQLVEELRDRESERE
jgi:hypothetical protein